MTAKPASCAPTASGCRSRPTAIAALHHALELDPLSLSVKSDLGWYYLFAGRWDEAADVCRRTLEGSPAHSWAAACLIEAAVQSGDETAAVRHAVEQLRAKGMEPAPPPAQMKQIYRLYLESEIEKDPGDDLFRALLHGRLGEPEAATARLERALERREPWLVFLRVDPRFSPLAGHPRFEAVASRLRIGLVEG